MRPSRVCQRSERQAFECPELLLFAEGVDLCRVVEGGIRQSAGEEDDLTFDPLVADAAGEVRQLRGEVRNHALFGGRLGDELTGEFIVSQFGQQRGHGQIAACLLDAGLDDLLGDRVLEPARIQMMHGPVEEFCIRLTQELDEP